MLYEFNQNSAMNANLLQTNLIGGAVAPVHFNKWGGTFGGPVCIPKVYNGKDKTFFFVSFDDTHNIESAGRRPRFPCRTLLERTRRFQPESFTTQTIGGQLQQVPDPGLRSVDRRIPPRATALCFRTIRFPPTG